MRAMALLPRGSGFRPSLVIDRLTLREAHVGLLPVLRASVRPAEAAGLAHLVDDLHRSHLDIEHELDGLLDVGFCRLAAYTERVLIVVLHRERRLFRHVRS